MKAWKAREYFFNKTKHLGAILWHNNRDSYYVKFKDNRIGSMRISNHPGRSQYSYKWDLRIDDVTTDLLDNIAETIEIYVKSLSCYNPDNYVSFIKGSYYILKDMDAYERAVKRQPLMDNDIICSLTDYEESLKPKKKILVYESVLPNTFLFAMEFAEGYFSFMSDSPTRKPKPDILMQGDEILCMRTNNGLLVREDILQTMRSN